VNEETTGALGRKDDDIEEALAQMATRDPSLWRILHTMQKSLADHKIEQRIGMAILICLGGSNNKFVEKAVQILAPAFAFITHTLGMK
jgi:hypothetical protein